jgi:hypothetical protein
MFEDPRVMTDRQLDGIDAPIDPSNDFVEFPVDQRLRGGMAFRDVPDLVADVLDRDFNSIQTPFNALEPPVDGLEPSVDGLEPLVNGLEPLVDPRKARIDLLLEPIQSIRDRVLVRHGLLSRKGATTIASSARSVYGNRRAERICSGFELTRPQRCRNCNPRAGVVRQSGERRRPHSRDVRLGALSVLWPGVHG